LENDRKVLNFDISWFDDKYDKEEKVYKMNYYLADGKVSYNFYYKIIYFYNIDRNKRNKSKQQWKGPFSFIVKQKQIT
jgi:hypothetical protein